MDRAENCRISFDRTGDDMKTDDKTLIAALRILAAEIQSGDGVANACIAEAADRLEEPTKEPSPFREPFTNPASGMGIPKQ